MSEPSIPTIVGLTGLNVALTAMFGVDAGAIASATIGAGLGQRYADPSKHWALGLAALCAVAILCAMFGSWIAAHAGGGDLAKRCLAAALGLGYYRIRDTVIAAIPESVSAFIARVIGRP